jgi:FMN reductase
MVWASPLYHGTVSGAFKNALDWLQLLGRDDPPYLTNTVIGLASVAGGVQGLQAVNTMEFVVRALRGWAVPLVVPVSRSHKVFDDQGRPTDSSVDERLRGLGAEVVRAARQFTQTGTCDYAEDGAGTASMET